MKITEFLSSLKRLFIPGETSPEKADPREPLAVQMTATRKTRRKILRRLARERKGQTAYLKTQSRKMAKAFNTSRLVRGITAAGYRRVLIGSEVKRMFETHSMARGRVIRIKKFKVLKHGKLLAV
jgi:hypothetical protein